MLIERLEYAARRYGDGKGLCLAAGLSAGYLGTLMTRLRRDPEAGMDAAAAVKIARTAEVSLTWLLTGEGPRDQRMPHALAALLRRVPPETYPQIVINQALLFSEGRERDTTEDVWRDYLDGLYRELRHVEMAAQHAELAPAQGHRPPLKPR